MSYSNLKAELCIQPTNTEAAGSLAYPKCICVTVHPRRLRLPGPNLSSVSRAKLHFHHTALVRCDLSVSPM